MSARDSSLPQDLADRVRVCNPHAISWKGVIYRAASAKYASSRDLVTGVGAKKVGGRWNPPGEFATVYGSHEPETAFAEALAHHRYYGMPVHLALPKVIAAINVRLTRVLDLSEKRVSDALRVDLASLAALDWRKELGAGREPETHALGRVIQKAGWEAFVVLSGARSGAKNLVIFPGNMRGASFLEGMGTDFVRPPEPRG